MLQCAVDVFLSDYGPFLPNDTLVNAAIRTLALLVTDEHEEPLWKFFKAEASFGSPETSIFETIEHIAGVFDDKIRQLNERKHHFFYRNYDGMSLIIPGSNLTLDACFSGNSGRASNEHDICADTAVVIKTSKSIKDFEDNRKKLVSAASRIMNDDPCRMWMYGITIENAEMTVWHFSRSRSVKSETFDFTKDYRTFIRVFLSFAYATPEEMGYDPTVHRIMDQGPQYVYEIPTDNGTRYFKTMSLLAHQGAMGGKTRVWTAVEVKGFEGDMSNEQLNHGRKVALKDVWVDDGSKTEKQKLDAIFERLRTIKEDAYQWAPPPLRSKLKTVFENEGYKDYFMEIVCDSFNLGKLKGTSEQAVEDRNMLTGSTQAIGYSHTRSDTTLLEAGLEKKTRSYKAKRQYRLVYKEIGESLDRVETLETAFNAILDTYIALVLMYLAGWMHRDVSAGNILAVKKPGGKSGGKLSDLEYAKHCEDESGSSDAKTGTAFFMPLEIHMGKPYKYAETASPLHSLTRIVKLDPFDKQSPVDKTLFSRTHRKPQPPPRLKYQFQHDLESLWWVALYVLLCRVDHPPAEVLSKKIFMSTSLPPLARQQFFEQQSAAMGQLDEFLHPTLRIDLIMIPMNAISSILYKSYFMDGPVDSKTLGSLYHDIFIQLALVVVAVRQCAQDVKFTLTRHGQPKKRAHAEAPPKPRDDDEHKGEGEEEPGSDRMMQY